MDTGLQREDIEKMRGVNRIFTALIPVFAIIWGLGLLGSVFLRGLIEW